MKWAWSYVRKSMRKDATPGETTSVRVVTKNLCDCERCRQSQGVKFVLPFKRYTYQNLFLWTCVSSRKCFSLENSIGTVAEAGIRYYYSIRYLIYYDGFLEVYITLLLLSETSTSFICTELRKESWLRWRVSCVSAVGLSKLHDQLLLDQPYGKWTLEKSPHNIVGQNFYEWVGYWLLCGSKAKRRGLWDAITNFMDQHGPLDEKSDNAVWACAPVQWEHQNIIVRSGPFYQRLELITIL